VAGSGACECSPSDELNTEMFDQKPIHNPYSLGLSVGHSIFVQVRGTSHRLGSMLRSDTSLALFLSRGNVDGWRSAVTIVDARDQKCRRWTLKR
jgi:hypothetical protein